MSDVTETIFQAAAAVLGTALREAMASGDMTTMERLVAAVPDAAILAARDAALVESQRRKAHEQLANEPSER